MFVKRVVEAMRPVSPKRVLAMLVTLPHTVKLTIPC